MLLLLSSLSVLRLQVILSACKRVPRIGFIDTGRWSITRLVADQVVAPEEGRVVREAYRQ
jgi:hypothetical protein